MNEDSIADHCKLRVYDPEPVLMPSDLSIERDKIRTLHSLESNTLVLTCTPLLTYKRTPEEGSISFICALKRLKSEDKARLLELTSDLYPRTREETIRGRRYFPQRLDREAEELRYEKYLPAPENSIQVRTEHNAFRTNNRWLLYLEASKLNHSCIPNCDWSLNRGHLVVRTIRPVLAGAELTISYIRFKGTGRERRNYLMKHHLFYCHCPVCSGRCHSCSEPVLRGTVLSKCGACSLVPYCSKQCQKNDWPEHKHLCDRVRL